MIGLFQKKIFSLSRTCWEYQFFFGFYPPGFPVKKINLPWSTWNFPFFCINPPWKSTFFPQFLVFPPPEFQWFLLYLPEFSSNSTHGVFSECYEMLPTMLKHSKKNHEENSPVTSLILVVTEHTRSTPIKTFIIMPNLFVITLCTQISIVLTALTLCTTHLANGWHKIWVPSNRAIVRTRIVEELQFRRARCTLVCVRTDARSTRMVTWSTRLRFTMLVIFSRAIFRALARIDVQEVAAVAFQTVSGAWSETRGACWVTVAAWVLR